MKTGSKRVVVITPSTLVARGVEAILREIGEFSVIGVLTDLSRTSEARLRNREVDVVLVDPTVVAVEERMLLKSRLAALTGGSVVALACSPCEGDVLRSFEGVVGLFDTPATLVRTLRGSLESGSEGVRAEGEELSAREKEILVCVAKGMLNKEIADKFNISIYTVITHRKNITRKTGIKTVAGLTVYALLNNLLDINSVEE